MSQTHAQSDAVLERLLALHPKRIDLVLDRIERLLAELGHPERKLPPVIHVAGTNGKGSVCVLVERVLRAAGVRTGLFTSPHLVDFRERFVIDGEAISEAHVVEFISRWTPTVHQRRASAPSGAGRPESNGWSETSANSSSGNAVRSAAVNSCV